MLLFLVMHNPIRFAAIKQDMAMLCAKRLNCFTINNKENESLIMKALNPPCRRV